MKTLFSKFYLLSFLLIGCSSAIERPQLEEVSNYDLKPLALPAITQVKQTLNLSAEQSTEAIVSILKNNNIKVINHNPENNSFESDWVFIEDLICSGHRLSNTPLSCKTKIFFKISSINEKASSVNMMHKEFCNVNEDLLLHCPNSKAEKMMFAVLDELKELDRSLNQKNWFTLSQDN